MISPIKPPRFLVYLCLVAGLSVLGCSGDGTTLGPDGRPSTNDLDDDSHAGDEVGTDGDDTGSGVTLAQLSEEIFTPRCATSGCHAGGAPAGGLSLVANAIAEQTINVEAVGNSNFKRVVPGDPVNSYLLIKLRGDEGMVGSQMPLRRSVLSDAEIAIIVAWVEAGAPTG